MSDLHRYILVVAWDLCIHLYHLYRGKCSITDLAEGTKTLNILLCPWRLTIRGGVYIQKFKFCTMSFSNDHI